MKKKNTNTINYTDLLINSSGKLGRHLDQVKSGCGWHKSKRDYTRKQKHKNKNIEV